MTKYPDLFKALAEDFTGEGEVKWKPGQGGKKMPYIDARVVMNRLDTVLGPECWWDSYAEHEHSVVCSLSILLDDGRVLTKCDAGGYAGMADQGDDAKSGYSDAFKRAAVKFGVGRLLYGQGVPDYGPESSQAAPQAPARRESPPARVERPEPVQELPTSQAIPGSEKAPLLPASKAQLLMEWCERHGHLNRASALARSNYKSSVSALGDDQCDALYKILRDSKISEPKPREAQGSTNENGNPVKFNWPKHGSALYAWAKSLEGHFNTSIIRAIDDQFSGPKSSYGYPRSYKEWSEDQVEMAAIWVAKLVQKMDGYDGQFDSKIPDLAQLKLDIGEAARQLRVSQGMAEPSFGMLNETCRQYSADLQDQGGELIDDIEQCENERLIKATLALMNRDLDEIKAVAGT